jgi:uncharacterized membrane protein HdeD (DUF308 family)
MSWSTTPVTPAALRGWTSPLLLLTGVAWLATAWSVLRLEPTDLAPVAGAVVLFGAVTEALRAIGGGRLWWVNAALAALFAVTAAVILFDGDGSLTTPSALIGWYLLVRGAADIVTSTVSRGSDRAWAAVLAVGLVEAGLGFYSASSFGRTPDVAVVVIGALALARGIADLTAASTQRATTAAAESPAEQAAGAAGYVAGMADYAAAATARSGRARHRAAATAGAAPGQDEQAPGSTADLDTMLAMAGVSGAVVGASPMAETIGAPASFGAAMPSMVAAGHPVDGSAGGPQTVPTMPHPGVEQTRPATMFSAPDMSAPAPEDSYRIPTGPTLGFPPAGTPVGGAAQGAQGAQGTTVRISAEAARAANATGTAKHEENGGTATRSSRIPGLGRRRAR